MIIGSGRVDANHASVRRSPSSSGTVDAVAEKPLGLGDVGLRVADVAGAGRPIARLQAGAGELLDAREQVVQRHARAGRDVDDLAGGRRCLDGAQDAVDDVRHVGEVARLLAVAVDGRRLLPSVTARRNSEITPE